MPATIVERGGLSFTYSSVATQPFIPHFVGYFFACPKIILDNFVKVLYNSGIKIFKEVEMREPYFDWQISGNEEFWIMKVHPCGWREFITNLGLVSYRRAQDRIDQLNYELENNLD